MIPGCQEIKYPVGKSPCGELRDEISSLVAILLSYNILLRSKYVLPPHNKVSVDDNTQHMQSEVTISTDGDFSEWETLFVTLAVRFYDE